MRKSVVASVALAAAALSLAVVPAVASASTHGKKSKPVVFTGKLTCSVKGTIRINPALTATGSSPTKLKFTGTLSKCKGNKKEKKATITGGTITAKGSSSSNSCAYFDGNIPAISGTAVFKTASKKHKAAPTAFKYSKGMVNPKNTSAVEIDYPATPGGTSSAKGSFKGTSDTLALITNQTAASFASACGPTGKGIKSVKVVSGTAVFG